MNEYGFRKEEALTKKRGDCFNLRGEFLGVMEIPPNARKTQGSYLQALNALHNYLLSVNNNTVPVSERGGEGSFV